MERLDRARSSLERSVRRALDRERQRFAQTRTRLDRAPALFLERRRSSLEHSHGRLRALSPRSTLARGYAIVRSDQRLVTSTTEVMRRDKISVEVADGSFGATVD
jgi:exodeoxyribonuclease VII large subunit